MDNKIKEALNVSKSQLISSKSLYDIGQYRDSITLSYYAMYSATMALLLKKGFAPKKHDSALSKLAEEYVKTGLFSKETYKYIHTAKSLRHKSSYDFFTEFSEDQAFKLIQQAEKFIEEAEFLL